MEFSIFLVMLAILSSALVYLGVKVVPQSKVYVIERFGKYTKTLESGLSLIVPFVDKVAHKVDILERQLPSFQISVITRDNVEVGLVSTVFFRVLDASKSVYRIKNIDLAIENTAISIIRSAAGQLELDDLQSSRESMNSEIKDRLVKAAEIWGVEVTRTEILDVLVDELTKESQRQQLNADAQLYEAKKSAEAVKISADADAYAIKVKAEADAEQTRVVGQAIKDDGQPAINFEIMKRQVDGLSELASSDQTKTLVVPSDITKALGSLELLLGTFSKDKDK